ncbi:MAG: hypothetical protein KKH94_10395 [Candidatus Omnitrophica bacterium]|nr:hypothetical protein [Candidatus Omnitrophota bacterium]
MKYNKERGVLLITSAFLITIITGTAAVFLMRTIYEAKAVEREVDRVRAYCAAEAGLQGVLSEIGTQSYTGFVNTSGYGALLLINGQQESACNATVTDETSDFLIVQSTGTGNFISRSFEARVFLDSNLSKYLVYASTSSFASGDDAQYGEPMTDPDTGLVIVDENGRARVPEDAYDRAEMYFTGDWNINGSNVDMYGDVYVGDDLNVTSGDDGDVYGDTFVTDQYNESGSLIVDDTYDDGVDKRTMTVDMQDTLSTIDLNFYASNNDIVAFGGASQSRYLEFVESADGTHTVVNEYNDRQYSNFVESYDLPQAGVVYVNGDAYIKGTIKGRVSIVASDDIWIQDSLGYANGLDHASESDAAAFLARDKLYFCGSNMDVSGIFYAERIASADPAFDAAYDTNGNYNPNAKQQLRIRGNRIINGTSNLSCYPDRAYIYDPYLKKFRAPGLPITSVVSFVREI